MVTPITARCHARDGAGKTGTEGEIIAIERWAVVDGHTVIPQATQRRTLLHNPRGIGPLFGQRQGPRVFVVQVVRRRNRVLPQQLLDEPLRLVYDRGWPRVPAVMCPRPNVLVVAVVAVVVVGDSGVEVCRSVCTAAAQRGGGVGLRERVVVG